MGVLCRSHNSGIVRTLVNTLTVYMYLTYITYCTICIVYCVSIHCTYTVGIPWIWIGVGWTMPFFFKPFRIAAKNNEQICYQSLIKLDPFKALCKQTMSCLSCVGEGAWCNLVETSSLWSFWLEQGWCLHQPGCETSSWRAHAGFLAYSGCSVVPSSYKEDPW